MSLSILDMIPNECPASDPVGDVRPEWRHGWNACRDAMRDRLEQLTIVERNQLILTLARGPRC